jgi:hypothetical protein
MREKTYRNLKVNTQNKKNHKKNRYGGVGCFLFESNHRVKQKRKKSLFAFQETERKQCSFPARFSFFYDFNLYK